MRCKLLTCVACRFVGDFPLGVVGSRIERTLFAVRQALHLGWRPTSKGVVCSDKCAMALAKDVTPARDQDVTTVAAA
jgi:hypothetical protein